MKISILFFKKLSFLKNKYKKYNNNKIIIIIIIMKSLILIWPLFFKIIY